MLSSIIYSTTQFARQPSEQIIEALLEDLVNDISLQRVEIGGVSMFSNKVKSLPPSPPPPAVYIISMNISEQRAKLLQILNTT